MRFISSPPTLSEPEPQEKVTGFVRMLLFRDRRSQWPRIAQNSPTRATPPPPSPTGTKLPVTVLKIHLQKEPRPHIRELMNHVLLSKYHRNENILIQALLPNPNLQPSCFSPIRALTASKEDRGESKGGSPGGIF